MLPKCKPDFEQLLVGQVEVQDRPRVLSFAGWHIHGQKLQLLPRRRRIFLQQQAPRTDASCSARDPEDEKVGGGRKGQTLPVGCSFLLSKVYHSIVFPRKQKRTLGKEPIRIEMATYHIAYWFNGSPCYQFIRSGSLDQCIFSSGAMVIS